MKFDPKDVPPALRMYLQGDDPPPPWLIEAIQGSQPQKKPTEQKAQEPPMAPRKKKSGFELELGKEYRSRDGKHKIVVVGEYLRSETYPFIVNVYDSKGDMAQEDEPMMKNGQYNRISDNHDLDAVELWEKPAEQPKQERSRNLKKQEKEVTGTHLDGHSVALEEMQTLLGSIKTPDHADFKKVEQIAKLVDVDISQFDQLGGVVLTVQKLLEKIKMDFSELVKKNDTSYFYMPTDVAFIKQDWHNTVARCVEMGRTVALRGPAGNGKTTGAKQILKDLGFNIYNIDCNDSLTADDLVGGIKLESTGQGQMKTTFQPGIFAKAFADPKGAILMDEFDALDPKLALCIQSALLRDSGGPGKRELSVPTNDGDKVMVSEGKCPIILTMNTYGSGATREYVGRNTLDAASLDRINTIVDTDYANEDKIVHARYPDLKKDKVNEIVAFAKRIRMKIAEKNMRIILSTRRLLDIAETILIDNTSTEKAWDVEFWGRMDEHERTKLKGAL